MEKIFSKEFDKAFLILEKSFPEDEIRPFEEQKALFLNPEYNMYKVEDEDLKAVMAVWEFDEFLFIEHFAVNPEYRNMGTGGKMLDELVSKTNKKICLEVEPPSDDVTTRRIEFYKRHGFFFNNYKYIQPSISKGRNPIPLFIMSSNGELSEQEFKNIKNKLYKEVYKIDNIC